MSSPGARYAGIRRAESLMLDAGTAQRLDPDAPKRYVPETDEYVTATSDLFSSRFKVQTRDVQAREEEVGGRTAVTVLLELHLPIDTAPLQVGDLWRIDAVGPGAALVAGQTLRVIAPFLKSQPTARRYPVEVAVA